MPFRTANLCRGAKGLPNPCSVTMIRSLLTARRHHGILMVIVLQPASGARVAARRAQCVQTLGGGLLAVGLLGAGFAIYLAIPKPPPCSSSECSSQDQPVELLIESIFLIPDDFVTVLCIAATCGTKALFMADKGGFDVPIARHIRNLFARKCAVGV